MERKFSLSKKLNWQVTSGVALGVSLLAGVGYFLHPFVSESSYAANTDISVSYAGENWNITPPTSTAADSGGLKFEIEGNPAGVNMAKKDTVTGGGTNVPNYQIYVSVNSEGGKIPATSGDSAIAATSGTSAAPAALGSNSWGYALASFDDTTNYDDLVSSSKSDSWSNSKWAKLPYVATDNLSNSETVEGTAAKIYDSTTDTGDSVDVYYAVNADNDLASGEYQTTVTYTLIGEMPVTPIANGMYLQDITPQMCGLTPEYDSTNADSTTFTVKDKRDNQDYRVRRLKMGTGSDTACWIVDNLKLTKTTIEAAGNNAKLDSSTSNVADDSSFALTASDTGTWCTTSDSTCNNKSILIDTGGTNGVLYNWYAATASTGTYSTTGVATASICPGKGTTASSTWHLPTGGASSANSEWYQLFQAYQSAYGWSNINSGGNSNTNNLSTTIGPDFVYSGYRYGAGTDGQPSTGHGRWWSSTAGRNNYAYVALVDNNGNIYGSTNDSGKYGGSAVRCVLPAA